MPMAADGTMLRYRERREAKRPQADDTLASAEIMKMDDHKRLVFGWAYITHDPGGQVSIDKSRDFVEGVEEIEKSAFDFVLNPSSAGADQTNIKCWAMFEAGRWSARSAAWAAYPGP